MISVRQSGIALRDYDPKLDTVERWGEERFAHIIATGRVDNWTHEIDDSHWEGQNENRMTPNHTSMLQTIGQQGEEIEQLITNNEDLKSENDQLAKEIRVRSWLNILFGSAVILTILVALMI